MINPEDYGFLSDLSGMVSNQPYESTGIPSVGQKKKPTAGIPSLRPGSPFLFEPNTVSPAQIIQKPYKVDVSNIDYTGKRTSAQEAHNQVWLIPPHHEEAQVNNTWDEGDQALYNAGGNVPAFLPAPAEEDEDPKLLKDYPLERVHIQGKPSPLVQINTEEYKPGLSVDDNFSQTGRTSQKDIPSNAGPGYFADINRSLADTTTHEGGLIPDPNNPKNIIRGPREPNVTPQQRQAMMDRKTAGMNQLKVGPAGHEIDSWYNHDRTKEGLAQRIRDLESDPTKAIPAGSGKSGKKAFMRQGEIANRLRSYYVGTFGEQP